MKKLYWLLLLLLPIYGILLLCGIHPFRYKQNSFHVRVGCISEGLPFSNSRWAFDYPIYFTNNNWATETAIMCTFDFSNDWHDANGVAYQRWTTSGDQQVSIKAASRFTSYSMCVRYNDSVKVKYKQLQAYRDLHPIKQIPIKKEEDCCKTIKIN